MAVINPRGELLLLNTVAQDLLALAEGIATSLSQFPKPVLALASAVLAGGGMSRTEEVPVELKGSRTRVLNISAYPLPFAPGENGVLLVIHGFKNENPLETRIRHLERLARLGVLSAGLAHDLRNAMVAISTFSEMILEREQDNEMVHTVRRELARANSLAAQMLKHARSNQTVFKTVSMHELLDRALTLAHSRLKGAGARLTTRLQADPDGVDADEAPMEQVFLNLLMNAADAIDSEGSISLSTELVDSQAKQQMMKVTVADSGTGVAKDDLPKLFQPFFTTKRHGTGLGLYLAQRIVHAHSGTITVESVQGEGTQVHVLLPMRADQGHT